MSNFFDILGVPQIWDVDMDRLQAKYLEAQRRWHPDRFVGKAQSEKNAALVQSALINEAYQTLQCPLKRGAHLLQLNGVETPKETMQDSELLMEVIAYQEMLLDGDEDVAEKLAAALSEAKKCFGEDLSTQKWENALRAHSKLSYLTKLMADIQNQAA